MTVVVNKKRTRFCFITELENLRTANYLLALPFLCRLRLFEYILDTDVGISLKIHRTATTAQI